MGLEISQIKDLSSRLNTKLSNMCFAYAVEQALAERNLPASVWNAVIVQDLQPEYVEQFKQYANHYYQLDENHKLQLDALMTQQQVAI